MTPAFERVAEAYGTEVASRPDIIRHVYEATGCQARWGAEAAAQRTAEAYEYAHLAADPGTFTASRCRGSADAE
jgi:hypothetical protein